MTALSDIALPQLSVLDSSMAYREAGSPAIPLRFFYTVIQRRRTSGEI
jgi:hypothetical protein